MKTSLAKNQITNTGRTGYMQLLKFSCPFVMYNQGMGFDLGVLVKRHKSGSSFQMTTITFLTLHFIDISDGLSWWNEVFVFLHLIKRLIHRQLVYTSHWGQILEAGQHRHWGSLKAIYLYKLYTTCTLQVLYIYQNFGIKCRFILWSNFQLMYFLSTCNQFAIYINCF